VEFGSLTPTVDVFEAVLAVLLVLLGLPTAVYNVREAWAEKEWAIDDPDPAIRRLGLNRFDNARLLLLAMALIALGTLSALLVPSALQLAGGGTPDFQDVLNAVLQRVVYIGVVLCVAYKAINDAVWRRDVDRRRRQRPRTDPTKDAATAVALGERLEASLAANTALTAEARDRATEAYAEANTVNLKIEKLGIAAEAERAVERAERTDPPAAAGVRTVEAPVSVVVPPPPGGGPG
jgi:hypothetical protein